MRSFDIKKSLFGTLSRALLILLAALFLSACTMLPAGVSGSTLISARYGFSLEIPDCDFEAKYAKDIPLIFINPETGATVTVTVSDDVYGGGKDGDSDLALEYMARGLFFYVKEKKCLESKKATLGGVDAWYLRLSGEYKEVPLIFSTYVARHDKKIYDVTLFCSPGDFEASYVPFMKIVDSFRFKD
jgi:hypothetical protein